MSTLSRHPLPRSDHREAEGRTATPGRPCGGGHVAAGIHQGDSARTIPPRRPDAGRTLWQDTQAADLQNRHPGEAAQTVQHMGRTDERSAGTAGDP